MKIAILGWGSLIWNPGSLMLKGKWNKDGPYLPIEFARISRDDRLTLVLYPDADDVQTMWAHSSCAELDQAIENLGQREGTSTDIGFIPSDKRRSQIIAPKILNRMKGWAEEKGLDAVIWTDLPSNFKKKTGKDFNEDNVLEYLRRLKGDKLNKAKEYIENAPGQIDTKIRLRIEAELGWQRKIDRSLD